jgi:CRISPR-associated protein Cmr4
MTGRRTAGALFGLHALTSLHPGSGTALGVVDLPVQRERHTHWPNIGGSALKGVLRDAVREKVKFDQQLTDDPQPADGKKRKTGRDKANEAQEIVTIFGPPSADNNAAAGALSISDARLVAFPVRSLKGVFAWVTCAAVLERLKRDAGLAGLKPAFAVPQLAKETGACPADKSPCIVGQSLILEEFEFSKETGDITAAATWIADHLLPTEETHMATCDCLKKQLVLLHDDWFTHFVKHATEINARIALDPNTKTVKDGALFYQEFLPTETLFYAVALMNSARSGTGDPETLLKVLRDHLPPVLQVGGDETTGNQRIKQLNRTSCFWPSSEGIAKTCAAILRKRWPICNGWSASSRQPA